MKHANIALFVPHEGCPNQCVFCNQRSISGSTKKLTGDDVDAAVKTALDGCEKIDAQLAFFGGSFTAIERSYMLELLEKAKPYVDSGAIKGGIRVSTRPDAISDEILSILRSYKVTAIELGCQSMNDGVLSACKRGHTARHVEKACALIKSYGFELGVQMMTGLPGDTDETCLQTAQKLIFLKPDTVRIYPTVVLENTPLETLYRQGLYTPQTLEQTVVLCAKLLKMFDEANVRVIRLGLHSGGGVEEGYVAGVYHPAFRQLCEAEIYRREFEKLIGESKNTHVYFSVAKGKTSSAVGHKRANVIWFAQRGINLHVRENGALSGYEVCPYTV